MLDLKQTLCDIVKAIVDDPSSISITETEENGTVNLELSVAPDDMGKHSISTMLIRRIDLLRIVL